MQFIPVVLRSILIIALLSRIAYGVAGFEKPDTTDQTIMSIKDCMARTPTTWPDEWKQQYLETIRNAIELHHDASRYADRLEILRNGFEPYWDDFKKTDERSLFEVHRTRIRWYIEHLMSTEFPSEIERQKLRDQYTYIWDYAAGSLLVQFPFLDPNTVEEAKAEGLIECYRKIDAPLMPVYLKSMSDEQVEQIKQRWNKLRYARIDLWLRLNGASTKHSENCDTLLPNAKRDCELTKESLSQLLGLVWMVIPQRPYYYLSALENQNKVLKRRFQTKRIAWNDQQRLEKERSRQLFQTEHISFLLTALLETPLCLQRNGSIITHEQSPLEQQDKTVKGGGAYEVGTVSNEK